MDVSEGDNTRQAEDQEKEEGLQLLFGELFSSDVNATAWENESLPESEDDVATAASVTETRSSNDMAKRRPKPFRGKEVPYEEEAFAFAYKCSGYCSQDGRVEKPPVKIVDLSSIGRGYGLVASRRIPRGEVLFTEKAAVASQIPQVSGISDKSCFPTRGCQNCFRSLETISSCEKVSSSGHSFPSPELWPVLDFEFSNNDGQDSECRRDRHGRHQCMSCQSWFCSSDCYSSFQRQFGPCCGVQRTMTELPKLLVGVGQAQEGVADVQPSVVLAVRMFAASLQLYRTERSKWENGTFLDGLCGDASDVEPLELGTSSRDKDGKVHCNLLDIYNFLVDVFSVSPTENETFSLDYLHKMAAKGARNGFGILTQSPFKSYYGALLRTAGGRGSDKHDALKEQVARALGSDSGVLERGMDRLVEQRVAVEIAAIFPLTARINHSCAPNAEVRSQEFIDCHMDLVAITDIEQDDEVTISYIPTRARKQNRQRRRRELAAKYLFSCDCEACQAEG